MSPDNPTSIPDAPGRASARVARRFVFTVSLAIGVTAAWIYAAQDLALSHYDARAHLVVSRRVIDSLTPGWRQFGAVWLPLPHLLNAIPTQWDWAYRTGAVAVGLSIGALAWGLAALAGWLARETRSLVTACVVPLVILLNPNVLYLQSTPMTEPLLLGCALVALTRVDEWVRQPSDRLARRAGWMLAALAWTRYEGWAITAALLSVAAIASWRTPAWRQWRHVAGYPAAAFGLFLLHSWAATGAWFVTGGFFTPDNPAYQQPGLALSQVVETTAALGGSALVMTGLAGAVLALGRGWRDRLALLPLALGAAAALPVYAFYSGHPLRVRYMAPLVVTCGVLAGVALARLPGRVRWLATLAWAAVVIAAVPPLDRHAPMVLEAQWERPFQRERERVSAYLASGHDGTPILASMGSLGHYMQESASIGLNLRHYLHEGNGDLWHAALASPGRHVRWILIEERAEGGDALAALARADPQWLAGFSRVAEGGGLVLYREDLGGHWRWDGVRPRITGV